MYKNMKNSKCKKCKNTKSLKNTKNHLGAKTKKKVKMHLRASNTGYEMTD